MMLSSVGSATSSEWTRKGDILPARYSATSGRSSIAAHPHPTVRFSPAIHAPYSVSFELIDRIVAEARRRHVPTYIHLVEDPAGREVYGTGEGDWRGFLEEIGVWDDGFTPPPASTRSNGSTGGDISTNGSSQST